MTIQEREQQALEVYLKLLKSKGFGPETFATRIEFLNRLMPLLADKPTQGTEYRQIVDTLVAETPEEQWPESLQIAREYFPFWVDDIKAVTQFSKSISEDSLPIDWKPMHIELAQLWQTVDQEKFGTAEAWALKAYTKALRNENADPVLIETRVKLVKILLVRIKSAPVKDNKAFRIAVDATVPLFELKKNRRLFLAVSREFFHFWAGNPDAEKYILNANTVSATD